VTDWATLADAGTAAGTLVLAGATFVDILYADHEGGQPAIARFVLLPEAGSWRCDATRHWSLPAT
jgi:hypothetical protein